MSNIYNHRAMVPANPASSKVLELLDAIKQEFESIAQDANVLKIQRDELEHKISAQIQEMTAFQQSVYDLERTHQKLKQQYEEEIIRLRRELDQTRSQPATGAPPNAPSQSKMAPGGLASTPSLPPPPLSAGYGAGSTPSSNMSPNSVQLSSDRSQQHPNKRLRQDEPLNGPGLPSFQRGLPSQNISIPPLGNQAPNLPSQSLGMLDRSKPQQPTKTAAAPGGVSHTSKADHYALSEMLQQPNMIPNNLKKEGVDWVAVFNPKIPRTISVELVHTLEHKSVVCCVRFSNDGKFLATGCNRTAQIFDVNSGQKIATLSAEETTPAQNSGNYVDLYIRSVCFSPDGKYLAAGVEDQLIRVWDIKNPSSPRLHRLFTGHDQDIYSLDFSRDGRFLVSGSGDRTAKVWDLESGKCIFTLANDSVGHKDAGVTSVAISPDGRIIAAASLDKQIRIWDAQNGYFINRFEGHEDSVYSVAFGPDGQYLVSGSLDTTLKLWDLAQRNKGPPGVEGEQGPCIQTFYGHKDFVLSVAFSPDGGFIVSGSKDQTVGFWDPRTGLPHMMLRGHKNSVISVSMSPSQPLLATGSGDHKARIWRYDTWPANSQSSYSTTQQQDSHYVPSSTQQSMHLNSQQQPSHQSLPPVNPPAGTFNSRSLPSVQVPPSHSGGVTASPNMGSGMNQGPAKMGSGQSSALANLATLSTMNKPLATSGSRNPMPNNVTNSNRNDRVYTQSNSGGQTPTSSNSASPPPALPPVTNATSNGSAAEVISDSNIPQVAPQPNQDVSPQPAKPQEADGSDSLGGESNVENSTANKARSGSGESADTPNGENN